MPSTRMHREADLTLKQLFYVHEYGTLITRGNSLIRIPPRPALFNSYKKVLQKRSKTELSQKFKRAVTNYINTGKDIQINEMIKKYTDGIQAEVS